MAFRRAANVVARLEDQHHLQRPGGREPRAQAGAGPKSPSRPLWEVLGGQESDGLYEAAQQARRSAIAARPARSTPSGGQGLPNWAPWEKRSSASSPRPWATSRPDYHLGPFACVLDQVYFNAAQTPNASSLVLPQDRILPFLGGGALVRSSTLGQRTGLVVALGGAPIDLVVGTDISVEFLQVTGAAVLRLPRVREDRAAHQGSERHPRHSLSHQGRLTTARHGREQEHSRMGTAIRNEPR